LLVDAAKHVTLQLCVCICHQYFNLHAGYLRHSNTDTRLFNTYTFPTATMVT
jgi:hypothetical protein